MKKNNSENLKKLRLLVNKIETQKIDFYDDSHIYEGLNKEIDILIHEEISKINLETDTNNKLKSYECLFTTILNLLEGNKELVLVKKENI